MAKAQEIAGLDCDADAALGVPLVLRTRLEEMGQLRAAALNWTDVEGVHDMRVASRRLRSALKDFAPYLREKKLRRARDYLKAVADALGEVRDQDVAILALEELKKEAPDELAPGIELLTAERDAQREEARTRLQETISEGAIARLQGEFIFALEHGVKTPRSQMNAAEDEEVAAAVVVVVAVNFRHAGRDIIDASFRKLQKLSASLYEPFETEPLHEMRIAAKRLRYAIELFAQCWGESLKSFAEEIAEMQSDLGVLHDCDEWIATLGERLRSQRSESSVTEAETETRVEEEKHRAAIWLLGQFSKARTKHYRAALARWHKWEEEGFIRNLMARLDREPESIEPAPLESSEAESEAETITSESAVETVASDSQIA
jgi:CHAD domain-containing protein